MEHELQHYGVPGMKWGVRRTAAQLGHKVKTYKTKRKRAKALEKARKTKAENKAREEEKKKAIASGDLKTIMKYKDSMNNDEMEYAIQRISKTQRLAELQNRDVKTGLSRVEAVMNKIERTRQMTEKGINAYNTIAKINNSLSPNKLPTLDGQYRDAAKEAQKARDEAEQKRVQKIVDYGSTKDLLDNMGKMTGSQMQTAQQRLENQTKLIETINKTNGTSANDLDRIVKSGDIKEIRDHLGEYNVTQIGDISKRFGFEDTVNKRYDKYLKEKQS